LEQRLFPIGGEYRPTHCPERISGPRSTTKGGLSVKIKGECRNGRSLRFSLKKSSKWNHKKKEDVKDSIGTSNKEDGTKVLGVSVYESAGRGGAKARNQGGAFQLVHHPS